MDEDAPADAVGSETTQWRRDASTSRTVRLLWSLGVGTFFAMAVIVLSWRFYDFAAQGGAGIIVVAVLLALVATVLALAIAPNTEARLQAIARRLPMDQPSEAALSRVVDAALGTIVMMTIIGTLMGIGRYVSQRELLEVGAGPFTGMAALLLPLALVALALASFLRSVGTLDREERVIYLHDPDQRVALEHIEATSAREIGDVTVVKLAYAQPDGQYVAGPRRIALPPAVARELEGLVDGRRA